MSNFRELYNKMLLSLESGAFMQFSGYSIAGRTFNYRSLSEFKEILAWVKEQAELEEGKTAYLGRTYASNARSR